MVDISKGKSPFYPGQPVPVELFVGRNEQIGKILTRGVMQVAQGKPVAMFIQGEYGIGKSSIAGFTQWVAEREYDLHAIYAPLGGCTELSDVALAVLTATLRSGACDPKRWDIIRNWMAKYIGSQELFGITLRIDTLKQDAPGLSSEFGMLDFFGRIMERLKDTGIKGIFLVFDEINGITSNPQFATFIKGLIDTNAVSREPIPLILMVCGVAEKRWEMIRKHQPTERIFDIIDIGALSEQEMFEFFKRAFESVQMTATDEAISVLAHYSAGFPKIMHLVGDSAFWIDKDGVIDRNDALDGVIMAADEVGKKYVDQQVFQALRSDDYRSILKKIGEISPEHLSFKRSDITQKLTKTEKDKFENFLQRMKRLKVLKSGDSEGEYIFISRMVRLYIWMRSLKQINRNTKNHGNK